MSKSTVVSIIKISEKEIEEEMRSMRSKMELEIRELKMKQTRNDESINLLQNSADRNTEFVKKRIAEAKAKMEKLSYDRIFLAQEISSSISGSYEKLKSMQEKVLLAGKNVESSEEIAKLTQEGYEYGRMNLLQVLTSKQNLKLAQDTYFLTLIDLQDAAGELEKALGFPISEAAL